MNEQSWKTILAAERQVRSLAPWLGISGQQLFTLKRDNPLDNVFVNIIGLQDGNCGLVFYEGLKQLQDYMLLLARADLGVPYDYVMRRQNCLALTYGQADDVPEEQMNIYKKSGFAPAEGWPMFLSLRTGLQPWGLDDEETARMAMLLPEFAAAWNCWLDSGKPVFATDQMFLYDAQNGTGRVTVLPLKDYGTNLLQIDRNQVLEVMKGCEETEQTVEADLRYMPVAVDHPGYGRPIRPLAFLAAETESGWLMHMQMGKPDMNPGQLLIEGLITAMQKHGIPAVIRVRGDLFAAMIDSLCDPLGIRVEQSPALPAADEAFKGLNDYFESRHSEFLS